MRPIKFRAWFEKNKEMVLPDSLQISHRDGEYRTRVSARITLAGNASWSHYFDEPLLLQFTGLHDKNGKEIYEGDICKFGYYDENLEDLVSIAEVVITTPLGCRLRYKKTLYAPIDYGVKDFEVIGNIYENPELLK